MTIASKSRSGSVLTLRIAACAAIASSCQPAKPMHRKTSGHENAIRNTERRYAAVPDVGPTAGGDNRRPPALCQGEPSKLREQLLAGFGVLDDDRAHRAVLRRFEDFFLGVTLRIDRLRLTVVVHAKHIRGVGLAHLIADAEKVIDPDAQLAGHRPLLLPVDRQR